MKARWEKLTKSLKDFFRRTINGAKGAISLFLVLTFAPLLSIALILVEGVRFQNAYALVQEVIDSSAFSTLAYTDQYLDERFGLLAMSQEKPVNDNFSKFFRANKKLLGNTVDIQDPSASGTLDLSDKAIFKEQVYDYSEYMVVAQMAAEALNLKELFDALKGNSIEKLEGYVESAQKTADAVEVFTTLTKSVSTVIKAAKEHEEAIQNYENDYEQLEDNIEDVVDALEQAKDNLGDEDSPDAIWEKSSVKRALRRARTASEDYRESGRMYIAKKEQLEREIDKFLDNIQDLPSSFNELKGKFEQIRNGSAQSGTNTDNVTEEQAKADDGTQGKKEQRAGQEFLKKALEAMYDVFVQSVKPNYKESLDQEFDQLRHQRAEVEKLKTALTARLNEMTTTDYEAQKYMIDEYWSRNDTHAYFSPLDLQTLSDTMSTLWENMQNTLDDIAKPDPGIKAFLISLVRVFSNLSQVGVLWDGSLDKQVVGSSFTASSGGMNLASGIGIESLKNLTSAIQDFANVLTDNSIVGKFLSLLKAVGKMLLSIIEFMGGLITWTVNVVAKLVANTADMVMALGGGVGNSVGEGMKHLLLVGYATYNNPNRISYKDGSTMTGHSFSDIFMLADGHMTSSGLDGLFKGFSEADLQTGAGGDPMFAGAIGEYMLIGSYGEKANQAATFMNMLYFRMYANIFGVFTNEGLQAMNLAGFAGWAVKLIVLIVESILDAFLLVNGGVVPFFKTKDIWCSAAGFPKYIEALRETEVLFGKDNDKAKETNEKLQNALEDGKDDIKKISSPGGGDELTTGQKVKGAFNQTNYQDHLFLLIAGTVGKDALVSRMQSLVQMEAQKYHKNQGAAFDLHKAYTHVETKTQYSLKAFLKFPGLQDAYAKTMTSYSGY